MLTKRFVGCTDATLARVKDSPGMSPAEGIELRVPAVGQQEHGAVSSEDPRQVLPDAPHLPNVHLGVSRDLRRWHNLGPLLEVRPNMWGGSRMGAGASPLWTPHGWLLLYHGVDDRRTYRLGIALLDLEHPRHVLAQTTRSSIARSPTRAKGSCPMLSSPAARWNWGTASSDTTGAPTASSAWRRSSRTPPPKAERISSRR